MRLNEIIDIVNKNTGLSKLELRLAINEFLDVIKETVKNEPVTLYKFGKFYKAERKAYKGVNPATGESIDIPVTNSVRFKPSTVLKNT